MCRQREVTIPKPNNQIREKAAEDTIFESLAASPIYRARHSRHEPPRLLLDGFSWHIGCVCLRGTHCRG